MRGNWTSVGRMYLGREIPLFFLLFSNPHSSKTISDDKTHPTFFPTVISSNTEVSSSHGIITFRFLSRPCTLTASQ